MVKMDQRVVPVFYSILLGIISMKMVFYVTIVLRKIWKRSMIKHDQMLVKLNNLGVVHMIYLIVVLK